MSTRGTIKFYEEAVNGDKEFKLSLYNNLDSYPSGLGRKIVDFLGNIKIVNGFTFNDKAFEVANGFDDLMLQFVVAIKGNSVGNVYLARESETEEWNYEIIYNPSINTFIIKVDSFGDEEFSGTLQEFKRTFLEEKK